MVRVVDQAPESLAFWVAAGMLDVYDEFVADLLPVSMITNNLRLDNQGVFRKQKVHLSIGASIARRELLRSNVRDPWPKKSMQKILNC